MIGLTVLLVLLAIGAIAAPLIAAHGPTSIDLRAYRLGPARSLARHRHSRPRRLQPAALRRPGLVVSRAGRGLDLHRDRDRARCRRGLFRRLGRFDDHAARRRRALVPHADHHHHPRLGPRAEHLQRHARDRRPRLAADRPPLARRVALAAGARVRARGAQPSAVANVRLIFRHLLPNAMAPVHRRRDLRHRLRDPDRSRPQLPRASACNPPPRAGATCSPTPNR